MSRARDLANFASDSQINAGEIEDNAVTTAKIADSNVTNVKLANSTIIVSGDSGSDSVALGETLTISGTANEIETTGTSNTLTIGLPDDVTIAGDLTVDTDTLYVDSTNNRVGIGTSSPGYPLHVVGSADGSQLEALTLTNSAGTDGSEVAIRFINSTDIDNGPNANEISSIRNGTNDHDLVFSTSNGSVTERLRITSEGYVGIGTTSPNVPLHVNGDVRIQGTNALRFNTNGGIRYSSGLGGLEIYGASTENIILRTNTGGDIIFQTTSTERMRIDETTGNVSIDNDLTVTGNLTINGTTTTVNSTNTQVTDNLLELNSGATSNANDAGIIIERGSTGDNAIMMWDESADTFRFGTTTATASDTGNLTITESPVITGKLTVHTSDDTIFYSIPGSDYTNDQANAYFGFTSDGTSPGTTNYGYWSQFKITAGGSAGRSNLQIGMRRADGDADYPDLVVTHEGRVGIGTSSPLHPLQVQGVIYPTTYLQLNSGQQVKFGNGNQYIEGTNDTSLELATGGSTSMIINNSGQVGIGTTSPNNNNLIHARLASASLPSTSNQSVGLFENSVNSWITVGAGATSYAGILFADSGDADVGQLRYNHNDDSMQLVVNADVKVHIDSSGNVGIGTSSPDGTLHVFTASSGTVTANGNADDLVIENNGTTGLSILSSSGQNGNIYFGTPDDNKSAEVVWVDGSDQLLIGTSSAGGNIKFRTGAQSDAVVIDSSGKLGIGTTSPQRTLHVVGPDGTAGVSEGNSNCTLYVDNNDSCIINIQSGTGSTDYGAIFFSDAEAQNRGAIYYYHPTNDILFNTNGAERMRIDSSGRVLVGKSSGTYPLDVDSGDYVGNILRGTRGTASFTIYQATDSHSYLGTTNAADLIINTNNTERMRIHSEGYTELKSSDSYNQLVLTPSGTNAPASINFNTPGTGRAKIKVQDQEYISILSTGNVGIQAIPSAWDSVYVNLQIGDTGINYAKNDGNELYGIGSNFYYDGTSNKRIIAGYASRQYFVNGGVFWNTASTSTAGSSITFDERMRLTNTGYLGIGTSSPNRQLTVSGSANIVNSNAGLYIGTSTSGGFGGNHAIARAALANYHITGSGEGDFCIGAAWQKDILLGTSTATSGSLYARLVITQSGNVGIGITNPGVALDVSGAIRATGDITAFYSSDIKLKTNVENIQNPIDKVKQLNGVSYNWTEEAQKKYNHFTDNKEIGVIAQDVEKVLPEIVAERDDGTKAVRYERMCALLIECVKDLQNQIDDLKKGN